MVTNKTYTLKAHDNLFITITLDYCTKRLIVESNDKEFCCDEIASSILVIYALFRWVVDTITVDCLCDNIILDDSFLTSANNMLEDIENWYYIQRTSYKMFYINFLKNMMINA